MKEIIAQLQELANDYVPSEEVARELSDVVLAPVVGPAAIGKNTCVSAVADIDGEFGGSQGFTTRPKVSRDAVEEYRFLPHDNETLGWLLDSVRKGELVQYAVHPTTGFIYGSEVSDYGYPHIMLDTLAGSVAPLRQLPFKNIVEIALIMNPKEWIQRFEKTRGSDPADMAKRLVEAQQSLEWSLEQEDRIAWINNVVGHLETTAHEIRGVIKGEREPNRRNRLIGEQLLKAVRLKIDS